MTGNFTFYIYDFVDGMSSSYSYTFSKGRVINSRTKEVISDPETIEWIKEKIAECKKTGSIVLFTGTLP